MIVRSNCFSAFAATVPNVNRVEMVWQQPCWPTMRLNPLWFCDSLLSCKLVSAIRACPHLSVLKLVFKLGKQIQKSQKNDGLLIQRECRFRRHLILLSFVPSSSKNKDDSKFFTEIDSIRSPNEILQNFLTAKLCRYLRSQKIDRRCKTCSQRRR